MLIRLHKNSKGLELGYENIETTENIVETDRFFYFFDVNIVDKKQVIEELEAQKNIITYLEINKLMKGNFFAVIFDKSNKELTVYRDKSGIKSGYYHQQSDALIVGTNVHDVTLKAGVKLFNKNAVYKYIYGDFLFNGETFYEEVSEFKRGGSYSFDNLLKLKSESFSKIELPNQDNKLSEEQNINQLRKEIDIAHEDYLCEKNNILLSGGIDSVAMLIALDDITTKDKIHSISYKVKETLEDETFYAKSIADHLDVPIEIKEIDPKSKINYASFEERILKMNNPYVGMWIFGNFKGTPNEMFYAGQDTRLHTPSVNPIDRIAFSLVALKDNVFVLIIAKIAALFRGLLSMFNYSENKYLRELYKLSYVFNVEEYISKYYFKLDKENFESYGFPTEVYQELELYFKLDYTKIKSPRALYNKIVELKWSEQYINDIRYLQDIAKLNTTYIAMPFYLEPIAKFSAGIPFKLSIKTMMGRGRFSNKKRLVKKYMLRQSLKDKMNDDVYYRAKAVSSSMYLVFNGVLGDLVREELKRDLLVENSFIKQFQLNAFIDNFLNTNEFKISDEGYLLKVYQLGMLAVYNRTVLKTS
ncbi:asparagine synthase-related protein [Vicingaceae bacterium]|nr:asparagine synthase-related protein [Vicingaceae bacterium]